RLGRRLGRGRRRLVGGGGGGRRDVAVRFRLLVIVVVVVVLGRLAGRVPSGDADQDVAPRPARRRRGERRGDWRATDRRARGSGVRRRRRGRARGRRLGGGGRAGGHRARALGGFEQTDALEHLARQRGRVADREAEVVEDPRE